jgi:glycosyltransferase involved in cell wall biosynthesis
MPLRILLCSVPYAPSIGGIETVSWLLAREFTALGHETTVVTRTRSQETEGDPWPVLRDPPARALLRAVRRADVVLHNNVSLRFAWPFALAPRPWVVAHHVWIPARGLAARAKRASLPAARHIAVSRAVARSLRVRCDVIPNPYDAARFVEHAGASRDRELVFVGRLVSDKGLPVLLDALALLASRGVAPRLTVVGTGPDAEALRAAVDRHGLTDRVKFSGALRGSELVEVLNRHRILVVPSTWEEPFGIVALEGLACGLWPIVTDGGGLPEAVGLCADVVPRGDSAALANAIERALQRREPTTERRAAIRAHLARHAPRRIARDYLRVLETAAGGTPSAAAVDDAA